jgi:hypothetical protein
MIRAASQTHQLPRGPRTAELAARGKPTDEQEGEGYSLGGLHEPCEHGARYGKAHGLRGRVRVQLPASCVELEYFSSIQKVMTRHGMAS